MIRNVSVTSVHVKGGTLDILSAGNEVEQGVALH